MSVHESFRAESAGLSLAPFRGLRFAVDSTRLGQLLCPPYDVIDASARRHLLDQDPDNVVRIVLPEAETGSAHVAKHSAPDEVEPAAPDQYAIAAELLTAWVDDGLLAVDAEATLYVYEMRTAATDTEPSTITRGLVGAVELRAPEDGVILPHENTMAGPVADRLALMEATEANLEPIYLVYDGGGAASELVAAVSDTQGEPGAIEPSEARSAAQPVSSAITPDGTHHRLWAVTDAAVLEAVAADLDSRHALIADGHHRYATYRQLADRRRPRDGRGPWDRGLALLVDSSAYGPAVHPIHRVVPGLSFDDAIERAARDFTVAESTDLDSALSTLSDEAILPADSFAAVVTDGSRAAVVSAPEADAIDSARRPDEPDALSALDVWILHRLLIERTWQLEDNEQTVRYAHSTAEALADAAENAGTAVLLRATPVAAVAAVAAAGARMPRKSTLFTPKPASGLVMRRFIDQPPA